MHQRTRLRTISWQQGFKGSTSGIPGSAMAPSNSCHSAVCLILPSWMTLEIIVPENTPLGKVT